MNKIFFAADKLFQEKVLYLPYRLERKSPLKITLKTK